MPKPPPTSLVVHLDIVEARLDDRIPQRQRCRYSLLNEKVFWILTTLPMSQAIHLPLRQVQQLIAAGDLDDSQPIGPRVVVDEQ